MIAFALSSTPAILVAGPKYKGLSPSVHAPGNRECHGLCIASSYRLADLRDDCREARIVSRLHGNRTHADKRKAPAEAEKTEKLNGAFTPNATVMESAKSKSSTPLSNAAIRVYKPTIKSTPRRVSATVATHANPHAACVGTYQFSFAV